jgi:hypothetical protein
VREREGERERQRQGQRRGERPVVVPGGTKNDIPFKPEEGG